MDQQKNNENLVCTAEELLRKAKDDKTIRVVKSVVPYDESVCLNDLSINGYGTEEDKIYAFSEYYRSNIRRGNTIVQVFDSSPNEERILFGRRGFEKFFDLMYQYIQYGLGEIKNFDEIGFKNSSEHEELYGVIFNRAERALAKDNKIVVYKLVKANGENAQVSWVEKLKSWIVASKNVSLLARNLKDLDVYPSERYNFAKLIAKEWFKHVERVEKLGLLDELQEYMNGKTFVGEYCGNQEYQHLVKYAEVDIHFVAIVDNNSDVTCISPIESFSIFQKYRLTCVKYQDMGVFENWEALNLGLKKIYEDVAKADIEAEEEGSVLYMAKRDKTGKEEVLSLSKLKTLEYRIYRKLREKLKHFVSQKSDSRRPWRELYKKFVDEVEELSQENKPPMPLGYYSALARQAFEFAESHKNKSAIIHDQYISFLSMLMNSMSQNQKLTPNLFTEENIANAMTIPWTEHYKNYKEENFKDEPLVENSEVVDQKADLPPEAMKVFVIVPIGMPGMGKSYCIETFRKVVQSNRCNFSVVSSDAARKEVMDKLAKSNKKLTTDQLFDKSGKEARDLYNDRVKELIFTSDKRKCPAHFIFLDKNHPPNALKGTFDLIKNNSPHLDLEIIALTPLINKNFFSFEDQGRKSSYPFSKNFFFNCLSRVQARKEHETLPGKGSDSAKVLAMFFQMMRGLRLNTESVLKNGFNQHLQIPFTDENNPAEIPDELVGYLIDILKVTKPGDSCNNEKLLTKFSKAVEESNIQFKNPDPTFVEACIAGFFQEKILPKISSNSSKPKENVSNSNVEESKIETLPQEQKKVETRTLTNTKKIYVIVPTGMPGMGKSFSIETFRRVAESYKCDFNIVSSDATRKEAMDELAQTNNKLTKAELFDKTGKRAKKMYDDRVGELIFTTDKRKCPAHFVFLDKNHPPNALKGTFELIRKNSSHLDLEIIALTPLINKNFFSYEDQGRKSYYPFSENFFFTCLNRVQGRKEHETLPGNGADSAKILAMFFQMMRGVRLDTASVLNNGFDKHLQIPFTNEDDPAKIPSELTESFVKLLKVTKAGGVEDEQALNQFCGAFEKSNVQCKNPDPAYVEQCIQSFFKDEILPSLCV